MPKAEQLAQQLRAIARREGKGVSGNDAEVLEAAAAELERLLGSVLFAHRLANERSKI